MYPAICCCPWHQIDIDGAPFHPRKGVLLFFKPPSDNKECFNQNEAMAIQLLSYLKAFKHPNIVFTLNPASNF
jgi:hypothetical protein